MFGVFIDFLYFYLICFWHLTFWTVYYPTAYMYPITFFTDISWPAFSLQLYIFFFVIDWGTWQKYLKVCLIHFRMTLAHISKVKMDFFFLMSTVPLIIKSNCNTRVFHLFNKLEQGFSFQKMYTFYMYRVFIAADIFFKNVFVFDIFENFLRNMYIATVNIYIYI